jgi:hypothetical protein
MTRYEALDRLVLLRKLMGHQIVRLEGVTGALPAMWSPEGLDPQDPVLQVGPKNLCCWWVGTFKRAVWTVPFVATLMLTVVVNVRSEA